MAELWLEKRQRSCHFFAPSPRGTTPCRVGYVAQSRGCRTARGRCPATGRVHATRSPAPLEDYEIIRRVWRPDNPGRPDNPTGRDPIIRRAWRPITDGPETDNPRGDPIIRRRAWRPDQPTGLETQSSDGPGDPINRRAWRPVLREGGMSARCLRLLPAHIDGPVGNLDHFGSIRAAVSYGTVEAVGRAMSAVTSPPFVGVNEMDSSHFDGCFRSRRVKRDRVGDRLVFDSDYDIPLARGNVHPLMVECLNGGQALANKASARRSARPRTPNAVRHIKWRVRPPAGWPPDGRHLVAERVQSRASAKSGRSSWARRQRPTAAPPPRRSTRCVRSLCERH